MNKILIGLVGIAALLGVLYFLPATKATGLKQYSSSTYGFSFSYPANYFIVESESASGERNQHSIVLLEDTQANRDLLANPQSATEAPPTITISLYQNNIDPYTNDGFIHNTNFSNFKLSDGNLLEVTVGGEKAQRYSATGLYENDNVVVARSNYVYMFTGFYSGVQDAIRADFNALVDSVVFMDAQAAQPTPTSADNAPPGSIHNLPVPPAVAAVRTLVAKEMGISEGLVIIMTAYEKEWSDGCLGLATADEMCTQAIVPGWEVTVQAQGKTGIYRTNADGSVIREQN